MMNAVDLADRLNLRGNSRGWWRGNCPACKYPGAFGVKEEQGGIIKLYCANGCDWNSLKTSVASATGRQAHNFGVPRNTAADLPNLPERRVLAQRIWNECTPIWGTLAATYLSQRGLKTLIYCPGLRFAADCHHPDGGRYPAMVASVVDSTGRLAAIHRTYLAPDGRGKAHIALPRASLGTIAGSAIRLDVHDPGRSLVVGEGIESSASGGYLKGLPAWSAVSAGNLAKTLILPAQVRLIVIAVDPDEAGRRSAVQAAQRWRAEGREVAMAYPDGPGDFNETLMVQEFCHVG